MYTETLSIMHFGILLLCAIISSIHTSLIFVTTIPTLLLPLYCKEVLYVCTKHAVNSLVLLMRVHTTLSIPIISTKGVHDIVL